MKKKYYKVVTEVRDEKGQTAYISARYGGLAEYKIGEWTIAPGNTRLFVFDNLDEAFDFAFLSEHIFECEIIGGIKGRGAFFSDNAPCFWRVFNSYLNKKKKVDFNKIFKNIEPTEFHSVLAKKVKLIKKIK